MTQHALAHQWEESGSVDSSRLLYCSRCAAMWWPEIGDPPSALCPPVETDPHSVRSTCLLSMEAGSVTAHVGGAS